MQNTVLVTFSFVVCCSVGQSRAEHENFCKPLEDYGPIEYKTKNRTVCKTELEKNCTEQKKKACMDVTELRCKVHATANCKMNWEYKNGTESEMIYKSIELKECEKYMKKEPHNKTIYECKNVTKTHCTTLWEYDDNGEKVWTGNEDDCIDETWEECFPMNITVDWQVPYMDCKNKSHKYWDFRNVDVKVMADTMDCEVEKAPVCKPELIRNKCGYVTYTTCSEMPVTKCKEVEIHVPTQEKLHKKWCLLDHQDPLDIPGQVEELIGTPEEYMKNKTNYLSTLWRKEVVNVTHTYGHGRLDHSKDNQLRNLYHFFISD